MIGYFINGSLKSYYSRSCSTLLKQGKEIKKTEAHKALLRVKSLHTPLVSVLSKRNCPRERERERGQLRLFHDKVDKQQTVELRTLSPASS